MPDSTRTALWIALALLAEAAMLWGLPESAPILRFGMYAALAGLAAFGLRSPPVFALLVLVGLAALGEAIAAYPDLGAFRSRTFGAGATGALVGALTVHFGPKLHAWVRRDPLWSRRLSERLPGAGLRARIGDAAYDVRDWCVFGLFIEVPRGRLAQTGNVAILLDGVDGVGGPAAKSVAAEAEIVRVADAGVALRFTRIDDLDRRALRRHFLGRAAVTGQSA